MGLRTEILVSPIDRSGDPISQMAVQRGARRRDPERVGHDRRTARCSDDMSRVDEVADGPLRPVDRYPGVAVVTFQPPESGPTANKVKRSSAASRRAHAPQPAPGISVSGVSPSGRSPYGRVAARGLELGAQRRDDRLGSRRDSGSSAVITSRAPESRRSASARRPPQLLRQPFKVSARRTGRRSPRRPPRQRRDVGAQPVRETLEQLRAHRRRLPPAACRRRAASRATECSSSAGPARDRQARRRRAASRRRRRSAPRYPRRRGRDRLDVARRDRRRPRRARRRGRRGRSAARSARARTAPRTRRRSSGCLPRGGDHGGVRPRPRRGAAAQAPPPASSSRSPIIRCACSSARSAASERLRARRWREARAPPAGPGRCCR